MVALAGCDDLIHRLLRILLNIVGAGAHASGDVELHADQSVVGPDLRCSVARVDFVV